MSEASKGVEAGRDVPVIRPTRRCDELWAFDLLGAARVNKICAKARPAEVRAKKD